MKEVKLKTSVIGKKLKWQAPNPDPKRSIPFKGGELATDEGKYLKEEIIKFQELKKCWQ